MKIKIHCSNIQQTKQTFDIYALLHFIHQAQCHPERYCSGLFMNVKHETWKQGDWIFVLSFIYTLIWGGNGCMDFLKAYIKIIKVHALATTLTGKRRYNIVWSTIIKKIAAHITHQFSSPSRLARTKNKGHTESLYMYLDKSLQENSRKQPGGEWAKSRKRRRWRDYLLIEGLLSPINPFHKFKSHKSRIKKHLTFNYMYTNTNKNNNKLI